MSKDLHALMPILTRALSPFLALCTDEPQTRSISPNRAISTNLIREAIRNGVEPIAVYRAASISAARAFGLRDRGLVAPAGGRISS